jgi:putative cardiolipin synthase
MQSKSAGTFNSEYRGTRERYLSSFDSDHNALVWASGEIVSDPPEKVEATTPETTLVGQRFNEEWAKARSEILIEEAYFLPGPDGPRHFLGYRSTGATVRILTSGAETTDVPIVYGAYRGYRAGLLEEGVQLYEFRRQPARRLPQGLWYQVRPPYAALHSKVMVFDRKTVWIGTFNLDPRSVRLNTEIVAVIHSEQLSRQLAGAIVDDLSSKLSWRVRLAQGRVTLTGEVDGRLITLRHEPMSVWRALEAFLLPLIPEVRDQL